MKSVFLEQFLLIKENQKLVNKQPINDIKNNSELIKSLLDQIEYLRRENFVKNNIISNLLKKNKVLFNNEENFSYTSDNSNLNNINNQKLSNIDNSNFENPRRVVKSKVTSEDKTKFDNFISPNRFSCLNNYSHFENSIDFNKEIVHNVTSSNKLTTSKDSIDISCTKECSKEPVRDQITPSKHSTVPSINSNRTLSNEPIRDRKIKTNRPNAPTTTIIGDSMIKKVFGDKLSRQLNNTHHVVVRSFGRAKTQCMEDYIKPTVKLDPN